MTEQRWVLVIYGGLMAALMCGAVVAWQRSRTAGGTDGHVPDLTDVELAALNGGPQLAAITAVTALRRSHVTQTAEGTLVANGPLAEGAGTLERELFETVRRTPGSPAKALVDSAAQSDTVKRIVAQLADAGLRLDEDASLRTTVLWVSAVVGCLSGSVALVVFSSTGGRESFPELGVLAALCAFAVTLASRFAKARKGATAAGRRVLRDAARARGAELRAAGGHVVFAVAMFGAAVLWATDPAFAAALDIPAQSDTSYADDGAACALGWAVGCRRCGGCGGCG